MDEISEIEDGMCDEDIFVLDPQITYRYNHLYLVEIGEMSVQEDFEDVLKNTISDCNR